MKSEPCCDVVVPVHGSLDAADDCLRSVLAYTPLLSRLVVIDDASDRHVAASLDALARERPRLHVVHNETNLGFVRASNRGLAETTAPFVCLLNSDTIVTPGWLEAMVRCAEADQRIAVVNPLSNAAVNLTVQFAPGTDIFTMAEAVAACSRRSDPDVVTAVGFCFLVTRAALEQFGGFDEVYGDGYCEESDYCMRVTGAGMRVVVADDAFVFHRGGASFGRSRERYRRNRKIFDERWADRYAVEYDEFMTRNALAYMRAELERGLVRNAASPFSLLQSASSRSQQAALGRLWAMTREAWEKGGFWMLVRKAPIMPRRLAEAARSLVRDHRVEPADPPAGREEHQPLEDPEQRRRVFATREYTRRLPRGRGLRIGILVWRFDICGGVLAIVELVNRLVLAGHTVVMATLDDRDMDAAFTLYARPLVFRSVEDLAEGLPDVDVVVATFWPTASEWLPAIRRSRPRLTAIYFVQDYESWFIPEDETTQRAKVIDSYEEADALIVTTAWLREKVAQHGHDAVVIPAGIDPRVFYPRRTQGSARPDIGDTATKRILVQARPFAPWRGFTRAVAALDHLTRRRRDVEVVFFGSTDAELATQSIPFSFRNEGPIFDRHTVAKLYSECDVLFDPSTYQAFGLPGLEAMACGVPAVLPRAGGTGEYAENERNALLVDPDDLDGRVTAVERLLDDAVLRGRLVTHGLATAARFTVEEMARRHLGVYREYARR